MVVCTSTSGGPEVQETKAGMMGKVRETCRCFLAPKKFPETLALSGCHQVREKEVNKPVRGSPSGLSVLASRSSERPILLLSRSR